MDYTWFMYYILDTMSETPHKTPVVFYRTAAGAEVVRDWLRKLDDADRNIIG